MLGIVNTNAYDALRNYISETSVASEALEGARGHAEEFSLPVPDEVTGQLLTTLAAASTRPGQSGEKPQAVAITPAASLVGLYLLEGLPDNGILTCIDPEVEHQSHAKSTFREAGYAGSRVRFLPSHPLDVLGRLAHEAYQLIYVEASPMDLPAIVKACWPLLSARGTLVLGDALLDGTIADETRTDRDTVAAREADAYLHTIEGAHVTRLPLGSGLSLVTKL